MDIERIVVSSLRIAMSRVGATHASEEHSTTSVTGFQTDLWFSIPVDVFQRGVVDVNVDWTFDETWMFVYFGDTECTAELRDETCPFLIASETKDPKPRILVTDGLIHLIFPCLSVMTI